MSRAMANRVSSVSSVSSGRSWQDRFLVISLAVGLILGVTSVTPLAQVARANPGLVVQDLGTVSATQLANALVGSGITISNVEYTGAAMASGTFSGGTGIIGFESGVVLTSGDVDNVVGPNIDDGITGTNGASGDTDLDALVSGTTDASVLEFDFVPTENAVSFNYVFASDEYNEFVNTAFNDVFAFFVNGVNCAFVNGDPVSINNVNGGNPFGTDASHPELFRNNDLNDPGPSTIDTEMDGLTVVLPCEAAVNPGTNHLKLAIADVGDTSLDSAVFIQAGSLEAVPEADLQVSKTADPVGDVQPGETITYTVTVNNDGPDDATGVLLTDTINGPATLDSGTFGIESTCDVDGNIASCAIGNLASDSSIDVTIVATADEEGTVMNTAVVSAEEVDPDSSNDQASTSNEVVAATVDLSIEKDDDPGPDPAAGGSDVTYTIVVTNNSETTSATGVTITDDAPAGSSLAPGSDECWTDSEGLSCSVGTLEPGAAATRTLVLTMPVVGEQTTVTNTASVFGDQSDPDLEDNTDAADTSVSPEASNEVNNLPVTPGDVISLTEGDASVQLIVGNVGNAQIDLALVPPEDDPVCDRFPCQSEVLFWNWDSFDQSADSTLIFDTGELKHKLQKRLWRLVPMFYEKEGRIHLLPGCRLAERSRFIPDRPCEDRRELGAGSHLIVTIIMTPGDPKSFR